MQLPALPDWLIRLDDKLETKISHAVADLDLDDTRAKQALNQWIKATRVAKKESSADNVIFSLTNTLVVEIKQTCQIESRSIESHSEPLKDKTIIDDELDSEDIWEHQAISGFQKLRDEWYRRGSRRVNKCDICYGEGTVTCLQCGGEGTIGQKCFWCGGTGDKIGNCPNCKGKGSIEATGIFVGGSRGTGFGGGIQSTPQQCIRCNATGKVSMGACSTCRGTGIDRKQCRHCKGAGKVICQDCQGQGYLLSCETIQANSKLDENVIVIHGIEGLKNTWLSEPKDVFSSSYEVNGNIDLGEQQPTRNLSDDERIFFEKYDVRVLPVAIAKIANADSKHNTLFFIGSDRQVRGSGLKAFRDIKRIILFRWVPAALLVSALLYAAIHASHDEPSNIIPPIAKDSTINSQPAPSSDTTASKVIKPKHKKSPHSDSLIHHRID